MSVPRVSIWRRSFMVIRSAEGTWARPIKAELEKTANTLREIARERGRR